MGKPGLWHPLYSDLIFADLDKAKRVFEKGNADPGMLVESNEKGCHFASHSGNVDCVSANPAALLLVVRFRPADSGTIDVGQPNSCRR